MSALTLDRWFDEPELQAAPLRVAYGMGVDSTAMLVGMWQRGIRPSAITFADTGAEKPETYAYLETIQAWCREVGFPAVEVVRNAPTVGANGTYATIEQNVLVNGTLPSLAFGGRACSEKWKHVPQHRYAQNWPEAQAAWAAGLKVLVAIGYDAGLKDCKRSEVASDKHYDYCYPLREWGWDRERCEREIAEAGLPVPPKSACFFCPSSKPDEVRGLSHDLLRRVIAIEAGAQPRQDERRAADQSAINGLWRRAVKGCRGATAKPDSMSEFIMGEELLPEFAGQTLVDPWWHRNHDGKGVTPTNPDFRPAMAQAVVASRRRVAMVA